MTMIAAPPALIQIEVGLQKRKCRGCYRQSLIPLFYRPARGGRGWEIGAKCAYCRSEMARRQEPAPLSERNATAAHDVKVDRYGHLRCRRCWSTLYREIVPLDVEDSGGRRYIVEWRCWLAGHVVLERWRSGSPVRGDFPYSPVVLSEKKTLGGNRATTWRRKRVETTARTVILDIEKSEACDARCVTIRYRNEDEDDSPVYLRTAHCADAHDAYWRRRANEPESGPPPVVVGSLTVDLYRREVYVDGRLVSLTAREWSIVSLLARLHGRVVDIQTILRSVWGDQYADGPHMLRVNMTRVRAKLDASNPTRFIDTRNGIGYVLLLEENAGASR